jgi:hypothetical protein
MCEQTKCSIFGIGAILLAGVGMAHASTTIYNDTFSTTGQGSAGYLNGTNTPGTTGTPADTVQWVAGTTANGGANIVTGGGYATATAFGSDSKAFGAYLPLTVAPNTQYVLQATLAPNVPTPTSGNWLALGFTSGGGLNVATYPFYNPVFALYRDNGGTQAFSNYTNAGTTGGTASTPGTADTITITLTTGSSISTGTADVAFSDTLGLFTSADNAVVPSSALKNIGGVGFDFYYNTGEVSAFSLTSSPVPEPAAFGLFGVGAMLMLLARKRKRHENCVSI